MNLSELASTLPRDYQKTGFLMMSGGTELKGTVMQIEKALINDRLHVSKVF